MTFNSRGWVSVVQLIVFIPSTITSFIICRRHGFSRSSGWIYTLILCIVRIVGAICQLATYSDHSTGLLEATIIIDSIGVSPLLLSTLGLLSRLVDQINARSQGMLTVKHFRLVQLLITLGLILSIAGGTGGSENSDGSIEPSTTSRVGIVLYLIAFVALVLILVVSLESLSALVRREQNVALGVMLAAPFILTRLVYSTLAVFIHDYHFNIIDGSVAILVAMAILEEFIVVIIYIFLGFRVDKLSLDQQGPIATRPWKERGGYLGRQSRDNWPRPPTEHVAYFVPPGNYPPQDNVYPTPSAYYPQPQRHYASPQTQPN